MSKAEAKRFDAPDEVRPFTGHGHVDLVQDRKSQPLVPNPPGAWMPRGCVFVLL